MHEQSGADPVLLYSRAELELELARITLVLKREARQVDDNGSGPQDAVGHVPAWFYAQSEYLIGRTAPQHQPYLERRLLDLASGNSWLSPGGQPAPASMSGSSATRGSRQD